MNVENMSEDWDMPPVSEEAIDRIISSMKENRKFFDLLSVNPEEPNLLGCPLCGSKQIQVCGDYNNLSQATARCRECKCTGPLTRWQNRINKDSLIFKMA